MTGNRLISWLPNLISLARLLSVPVAVYLILEGYYTSAFWIFFVAGLSDAADGLIANHYDARSVMGSYLDPLADKTLLVAVFLSLGSMEHIAVWLVILIVFRDLLIIGGAILFQTLTQSLKMEPLWISKVNTVAQITLAGFVLARLGLGMPGDVIESILTYAVAATTMVSGAVYVVKWSILAATYERER